MWESSGLGKFELAHVFSHKQDERRSEEKLFKKVDISKKPYGHFTSASNVVLIPKGYAKPTDSMLAIKACFFKRHIDLYGTNMYGLSGLDDLKIPSWYGDVDWLEPKLPIDWREKISNLLKYRSEYLKRKYA
ncbi:hypothetical protein WH50_23230 [Pokkaliibacter plantistimulans]|uniref:Uncharacterized protein n=2 Tax=Pokkaliibacter plantistimulans TaxID=1635171 RepID=A0ABX5LQP5_9GAMM|nr:hypothetical protein WH50_23230 [Pokkaliibacter plantistimulans]